MAGMLVCREKDYQSLCKRRRNSIRRRQGPPKVKYRLAVSTYKSSGNTYEVAFSDGSSATWHRECSVIKKQKRNSWWRSNKEEETRAAAALYELIEVIHDQSGGIDLAILKEKLASNHFEGDVRRAMDISKWWRLIKEARGRVVVLTDSGQHWRLASDASEAERIAERKRMSNGTGGAPKINIGNMSGVFNYAERDFIVNDGQNVQNNDVSDDRIISCIEEVLNSPNIPWSAPDLVTVRRVMEYAVTEKDPNVSGLSQAVSKLKEICGDVGIGMLGNGAYQLLMQHFL